MRELRIHVGRSWVGTHLEDDCPCPKAACGLVDLASASADCPQHSLGAAKTMRQIHYAHECPATRGAEPAEQASTASEPRGFPKGAA